VDLEGNGAGIEAFRVPTGMRDVLPLQSLAYPPQPRYLFIKHTGAPWLLGLRVAGLDLVSSPCLRAASRTQQVGIPSVPHLRARATFPSWQAVEVLPHKPLKRET